MVRNMFANNIFNNHRHCFTCMYDPSASTGPRIILASTPEYFIFLVLNYKGKKFGVSMLRNMFANNIFNNHRHCFTCMYDPSASTGPVAERVAANKTLPKRSFMVINCMARKLNQ
jgi:hypothetical protein